MRICIDIDGVLCDLRQEGQSYDEVLPKPGARDAITRLKQDGHAVILYTARHMRTCAGNVGLVVARQGRNTLDWLARHEFGYDELYFGKPDADVYIDDKALAYRSWSTQDCMGLSRRLGLKPNARSQHSVYSPGGLAVVLPVAGRGARFSEDPRFNLPKPIIDVAGRPMAWWALGSFEGIEIDVLVFVIHEEHERLFSLSSILTGAAKELRAEGRLSFGECTCVFERDQPRGQLTSVLAAANALNSASSLLIGACDTLVHSRLPQDLADAHGRAAGMLSVMKAEGDRWSFARLGIDHTVVEVREKTRISDHACTGLYYFANASEFLAAGRANVERRAQRGEYYVAPIYQDLIAGGRRIEVSHADIVFEMGTPAALDRFLSNLRQKILAYAG